MTIAVAIAALPVLAETVSPLTVRHAIDARYPGVPWVSLSTLAEWMNQDSPELVILDAREPAEFNVSHIRGARRVDPNQPDIGALQIPSGARVVVYCSVGYRSADVARQIIDAGYNQVFNLEGGIFLWANRGRSVYQGSQVVQRVHPYDEHWGRMLNARLRSAVE